MSHVHATRDDAVLASLSEVVGGPVGPRWRPARWGTPLAVLLAFTALTFALGMTTKGSCADRDFGTSNVRFTHLCYSDIPVSYTDGGLDQLAWPWSDDAQVRARFGVTTEPALVGLWQYAGARITHLLAGSPDLDPRYDVDPATLADQPAVARERVIFTAVNAVGLGLLAMLATALLSRVHRRRPWDALGFAAAPVLALSGLVGFDLISVVAVAGALLALARGRRMVAGGLIGLGAAAAVWPAVLLGAIGLVAWRRSADAARPVEAEPDTTYGFADPDLHSALSPMDLRTAARRLRRSAGARALGVQLLPVTAAAAVVWAVLNAPAFLSGRAQWQVFWQVTTHRGPDAGSVFTIIDQAVGIGAATAHAWSWALLAIWWVAVALLSLWAAVPPRISQVGFLLVAGVVMLAVVYQPQQALWLLPLAVLARPRWRDLLVWQAGEVLWFAIYWWLQAGVLAPGSGGPAGFSWIGIGVRLAATGWLVAVVVRDVLHAEHDPVLEERVAAEAGVR